MIMVKEKNVNYRAIHTKNSWRKASHESVENALGKSRGAKALFDGKAAIDYDKQGVPLYVIVWEDGAKYGFVVKPNSQIAGSLIKAEIPIQTILKYESVSNASKRELEALDFQNIE
jgi:hypothetical protein